MEKWLDKPGFVGTVQCLLSWGAGGTISWIVTAFFTDSKLVYIPIALTLAILILQIVFNIKYAKRTDKKYARISGLEEKNGELQDTVTALDDNCRHLRANIVTLGRILFKNSESLNELSHKIQSEGKYEESIWNFQAICDDLCDKMLQVLKQVALYGDDFSVSYIACSNSLNGSVRKKVCRNPIAMIGYGGDHEGRPTVYYPAAIPKQFYSRRLFREKPHNIVVLENKFKIREHFFASSSNLDKYNQYIGIPVFCGSKKMIGLIELVAYNTSMIGDATESSLRDFAETFFRSYAHLFLLMNKAEKAMLAKPPHK